MVEDRNESPEIQKQSINQIHVAPMYSQILLRESMIEIQSSQQSIKKSLLGPKYLSKPNKDSAQKTVEVDEVHIFDKEPLIGNTFKQYSETVLVPSSVPYSSNLPQQAPVMRMSHSNLFLMKKKAKLEPRFKIIRESQMIQIKAQSDDDDLFSSLSSGSGGDNQGRVQVELIKMRDQMKSLLKAMKKDRAKPNNMYLKECEQLWTQVLCQSRQDQL
ncbi:hypothetical protein FGO68_gene8057 [Halteria grandinella]|uniref:Uncharacterized protein n=1 Tax=Halteria grandinella TaxID=5974 RepID=A0A8J8T8Z5_HALGN|nr:hypothetical protein FGO68_gene8057 [Halteria grandinella]